MLEQVWRMHLKPLQAYLDHIECAPSVSSLDAISDTISIKLESSTLLKEKPNDPDALLLHMRACIHLEQWTEALNDLQTLKWWHPTHTATVVAESKMLLTRLRQRHGPLLPVGRPPLVNTQLAHAAPSRGTYNSAITDTSYYNRQHFNQMEYNVRHNEWRRQDNQYEFNRWYNGQP